MEEPFLTVAHPDLVLVDIQLALEYLLVHDVGQKCAINAVVEKRRQFEINRPSLAYRTRTHKTDFLRYVTGYWRMNAASHAFPANA